MTLKQYVALMVTATVLCSLALVFVLYSVDPFTATVWGMALFYLSAFLTLFGLFSLVFFAIESLFARRDTVVFRSVRKSFRQGILFAVLVTIVLMLAHAKMLEWWSVLLLAIGLSCIEFFWSHTGGRTVQR